MYLKIPWKSKIICVHLYVALLNLQFLIFFFRQTREKKICLEQGWGRSTNVQKSGSNNRGVAEVKDIMATGKRSQVARLVL